MAATMTYREATKLADQLAAQSEEKAALAGKALAEAEADDRAAKLIRAMLKQVHSSDTWKLE